MIVNGNNGVIVTFKQASDSVRSSFLHFWVGALHGVQFDGGAEFPGICAGYGSTAHPDTVVVPT